MPSVHKPWPTDRVTFCLDRIRVAGLTPGLRDAAQTIGKTFPAVSAYLRLHHRDAYEQAKLDYLAAKQGSASPLRPNSNTEPAPIIPKPGSFADVLEPPPPFAVPVPAPAPRAAGQPRKALIIPDVHIPFHDLGAVAVMEAILAEYQPDYLVCIGDLLDAGRLSQKFPTDPNRIDTLQDDINTARVKLHQWAELAPHAERWLLEGNHEQRLTRLIWGLEGAERELAKLDAFRDALTWPVMLGLAEIGWQWVAYDDQPRADVLPHLLVKHGNFVSAEAGMTAKREWQKYGHSGVSGHTHRAVIWRHKDYNGQATWVEAGCLCRYDTPGAASPNWQQAVTLIEWNADGSLMHAEQVLIREGRAWWRGAEYGG